MKIFKIIILFFVLFFIFFTYNYYVYKQVAYVPTSDQNNFYKKLDLAINTAKLEISSFQIRDFNNEVEFYLIANDSPTRVLISTLRDPFWQISTLQQVVKTAKMNQGKIKLVDLSSKHPYVTFKNN